MAIDKLMRVLRPPANPKEVPSASEWDECEAGLRQLPTDYKLFVTLYGTGCIDGFLYVFNPATTNVNLRIQDQVHRQLAVLRDTSSGANRLPFALCEGEETLLPFGISDNGDLLLWHVVGDPDTWHVVIVESRLWQYECFDTTFSEFFRLVLSRQVRVRIFPKDFPSERPSFTPV